MLRPPDKFLLFIFGHIFGFGLGYILISVLTKNDSALRQACVIAGIGFVFLIVTFIKILVQGWREINDDDDDDDDEDDDEDE